MEPPAVVTLIGSLTSHLQSQAAAASKLQDTCRSLGSLAQRFADIMSSVGAKAEAATLAELCSTQPQISTQIQCLNRELQQLCTSDSSPARLGVQITTAPAGFEPGSTESGSSRSSTPEGFEPEPSGARSTGLLQVHTHGREDDTMAHDQGAQAGTSGATENGREAEVEGEGSNGQTSAPGLKRIASRRCTASMSKVVEPPDFLLCPISRQLMTDPVVLVESGHSYQGEFIRQWLFKKNGRRDPMTNNTLVQWPPSLVRNHVLLKAVEEWKEKHPESYQSLCSSRSSQDLDAAAAAAALDNALPSAAADSAPSYAPSTSQTCNVGDPTAPPSSLPSISDSQFDKAVGRCFANLLMQHRTFFAHNTHSCSHTRDNRAEDQAASHPLHWACAVGWAQVVRALLERGLDPNTRDSEGHTPLELALVGGYVDVVQGLLAYGADVDMPGKDGRTPLHMGADSAALVHILLEAGADPGRVSRPALTPIFFAAKTSCRRVVELLLEHGASTWDEARDGVTPLHVAAKRGDPDVVEVLLEHHAIVDALAANQEVIRTTHNKRSGVTPLHWAARLGHNAAVELLLRKGADVNAQDSYRYTALHHACAIGNLDMVVTLLQYGADKTLKSRSNASARDLAKSSGHKDIAKLLK